jgi:hypothetical protein
MFLHPSEMHIQLMEMLQEGAEGRPFGHFGEGVHVFGEALAAIAVFAVNSF